MASTCVYLVQYDLVIFGALALLPGMMCMGIYPQVVAQEKSQISFDRPNAIVWVFTLGHKDIFLGKRSANQLDGHKAAVWVFTLGA